MKLRDSSKQKDNQYNWKLKGLNKFTGGSVIYEELEMKDVYTDYINRTFRREKNMVDSKKEVKSDFIGGGVSE